MRPALAVLLLAAILAPPALADEERTLPRGDDVFVLGATRTATRQALLGAGMKILKSEPGFILCEGRDPNVEYEQYGFFDTPHGDGVLWRVTLSYRLDVDQAVFAGADSALRGLLGDPTDDVASQGGDIFNPVPERRLRWLDSRTLVVLAARWPKERLPADRMIVEWFDLKYRRAI